MIPENDVKSLYADALGPPLMGALLRMPWQALRRRMLDGLAARGFDDVPEAYLTVFQWPGPQGRRPSELAARAKITRQAMNHLLGQLEQAGYLRRVRDTHSGRATRIELTDRGTKLGWAMREAVLDTEREWEEQLGPERMASLRELLGDLAQLV
jgi:DNA-binding MarR family transcriptional regulator